MHYKKGIEPGRMNISVKRPPRCKQQTATSAPLAEIPSGVAPALKTSKFIAHNRSPPWLRILHAPVANIAMTLRLIHAAGIEKIVMLSGDNQRTASAIETADIALMEDDLTRVAETILLGRRTLGIIRFNVIFNRSKGLQSALCFPTRPD